jgi:hypothetical protein
VSTEAITIKAAVECRDGLIRISPGCRIEIKPHLDKFRLAIWDDQSRRGFAANMTIPQIDELIDALVKLTGRRF